MATHFFPFPTRAGAVEASTNGVTSRLENHHTWYVVALTLAILATSTSLGIATYAGWQRDGLPVERAMNIMLGGVAVLYVHLLPMGARILRVPARICAFAIWCVCIMVVLYGQATFFMLSHQHAGDQRASTVPVIVVPPAAASPPSRMLTEIARDIAKVSGDLANARRCTDDCTALKVRRAVLAAKLSALNIEAGEVKRQHAEEDRRNEQADRNETLRMNLRADPVALQVASWLGTTERKLELLLAVACAIVLEGAAIMGWQLVSVVSGRAAVVSDCGSVKLNHAASCAAVISGRETVALGRDTSAPGGAVAAGDSASNPVTPEDDLLLKKIQEAVVTGQIKPTQEAIRKLLRCGQPKAASLRRQFRHRLGGMRRYGDDVRAPGVATPAVEDA